MSETENVDAPVQTEVHANEQAQVLPLEETPNTDGNNDPTDDNENEKETSAEPVATEPDDPTQTAIEPEGTAGVLEAHPLLTGDEKSFKQAAKTFLNIHRDEVAQRDREISTLRAELKRIREALKAIESAAEHSTSSRDGRAVQNQELTEDNPDVTFQKIKNIWETCFNAVHSVIEEDDVKDSLSDWSIVNWSELEDKMPGFNAFSAESSNKRSRTMLVMALLAKSLEEYIFTPNYLFEDDDELRFILHKMTDTRKKSQLRDLFLSMTGSDDFKDEVEKVKAFRVESAVDGAVKPIQSLLSEALCEKVKARLSDILCDVVKAWEPLQRYESHFEVSTEPGRAGREWLTLQLMDNNTVVLETVNSSAFSTNPVMAVVFPRVCAIDRSRRPAFTTVFPGVVFQKSQALIDESDTVCVDRATVPAPEDTVEAAAATANDPQDVSETVESPTTREVITFEPDKEPVIGQAVKEEMKPIEGQAAPITGSESENSSSEDESDDDSGTESNTEDN
ncbi:hypothetical protein PV08_08150 [Exophiala spinifera]|uniref:Uncharacterized protein n=1 Tax=Exophiala spinifera TaxID=91928 RepID=A0A0D2B249_9EURO|nr:uncharacterized protein PV08_08150 [Exophiala spinifera]KIW12963.1 hypothetical protein PV08_08150 [Exophiala spinifera]